VLGVLPCLVRVEVGAGEIAVFEPVGRGRVNAPGLASTQRRRSVSAAAVIEETARLP
jgi:hypothetical protein